MAETRETLHAHLREFVVRWRAKRRTKELEEKEASFVHTHNTRTLERFFNQWCVCAKKRTRWGRRVRQTIIVYGSLYAGMLRRFDARAVFSEEGKMAMARAYYAWRLQCIALSKLEAYAAGLRRRRGVP
eukprot:Colp12_sorted_trinity150504_noHs@18593